MSRRVCRHTTPSSRSWLFGLGLVAPVVVVTCFGTCHFHGRRRVSLFSNSNNNKNGDSDWTSAPNTNSNNNNDDDDDDVDLEKLLSLLDQAEDDFDTDDDDDDEPELDMLLEMLESDNENDDDDDDDGSANKGSTGTSPLALTSFSTTTTTTTKKNKKSPTQLLEDALLQEVVPAEAGVGSELLPGDFGFDPLGISKIDYPLQVQRFMLKLFAGDPYKDNDDKKEKEKDAPRPPALILRDYREAEIRHGRLAMLAAMIWPLQEMLDRLLLDDDLFGPLVYGPVTLPYFPLFMTLILMLLGYLDVYSQAMKEKDEMGEAFLPGDCFWDPLAILQGAPARMKRNMQERELFNGRVAMLAVAAFFFEEITSHQAIIAIPSNELLFEPAYTIPFIQEWLDGQFADLEPSSSALPDDFGAS